MHVCRAESEVALDGVATTEEDRTVMIAATRPGACAGANLPADPAR